MNELVFWNKNKLLSIFLRIFSIDKIIKKKEVLKEVKDDDEVSRFIMHKSRIRQDGTIRHTAFMPYIPEDKEFHELSLFCTTGVLIETVWSELAKIVTKKDPPKGRGIISAEPFYKDKLKFNLTPESHRLHIDAIDWPIEKSHQTLIAKKLANKAILERNPL